MKEKVLKEQLLSYISKDIKEIDGLVEGIHFFDKKVRPDLILNLKYSDILIVVEIKNDMAKNYNSNELLRQAINYKHSKYNGQIPDFVFVTTTKLMQGGGLTIPEQRAFGLAAKLGVGIISIYRKEQLRFTIGNEKIYTQDFSTGEKYFDFTPRQLTIGTKAKSNRVIRTT